MKRVTRFLVNVKKEMKKVRWPKRQDLIKYATATISFIIIFMVFFAGIDAIISLIMKLKVMG